MFLLFKYILDIYIMLLLIVQVILTFVKISILKLCFDFKIAGIVDSNSFKAYVVTSVRGVHMVYILLYYTYFF